MHTKKVVSCLWISVSLCTVISEAGTAAKSAVFITSYKFKHEAYELKLDVCWVLLGRVARHLVQLWGFTNLMLFTTQLLSVLCSKSICCRGAVPINRLTCYSNIAGRNGQVVPCLPVIWDSTVVSHYGHRYNSRCMCILAHRLHTFTALFEPT